MTFEPGAWYIFAGMIAIIVVVLGSLIGIIARLLVFKPIADLTVAIKALENSIAEFRTFIAKQGLENTQVEKKLGELTECYEGVEEKIQTIHSRISKIDKDTAENRHMINNLKQIHNLHHPKELD